MLNLIDSIPSTLWEGSVRLSTGRSTSQSVMSWQGQERHSRLGTCVISTVCVLCMGATIDSSVKEPFNCTYVVLRWLQSLQGSLWACPMFVVTRTQSAATVRMKVSSLGAAVLLIVSPGMLGSETE